MPITAVAQLPDKQALFAKGLVDGLTQTEAARRAGYKFPETEAVRLVRLPAVAAAIEEEMTRQFSLGAPAAFHTLMRLMKPEYPAAVQLNAAKAILDRAGFGERASKDKGLAEKPIGEMTEAELVKVAERLRQARIKAELSAPDVVDGQAQVIDIKDKDTV